MEKVHKSRKSRKSVRVRSKVMGTKFNPRLSVFRSNKYTYAQLIDDVSKRTLLAVPMSEVINHHSGGNKTEAAFKVGKSLAEAALKHNIHRIVFDRGSYKYHGRVKNLAEGAREGGLRF